MIEVEREGRDMGTMLTLYKFKEIGVRRCHAYLRGGAAPCLPRAFGLYYCLEIRLDYIVSLTFEISSLGSCHSIRIKSSHHYKDGMHLL
jgi:hypothetical protein